MTQLQKLLPKISSTSDLQIIFIHGLGGDIRNTWMNNPSDHTSLWPQWIADETGCCVWLVGYDASPSSWMGSPMELRTQARNILDSLTSDPAIKGKPMILIGHSLGGLIIKAMFAAVDSLGIISFQWFLQKLRGVAFIATPHHGSELAKMVLRVPGSRASRFIKALKTGDSELLDLNTQFRNKCADYKLVVRAYAETKRTPIFKIKLGRWNLPLLRLLVVSESSSDPGIQGEFAVPLQEDHVDIAKPKDRNSQIHRSVVAFINEIMKRETGEIECAKEYSVSQAPVFDPGTFPVRSVVMAVAPADQTPHEPSVVCSVIVITDEPVNFRGLLPHWREILLKDPLVPKGQRESLRDADLLELLENAYTRSRLLEWLAVTHFHAYIYYADTRLAVPANFDWEKAFFIDPLVHRISKKDERVVKYYSDLKLERELAKARVAVETKLHRSVRAAKWETANESDLLAIAKVLSWATRQHLMAVTDPEKSRVFEMLRTRIKFAQNVVTNETHTRSQNPLP